VYTAVSIKKLTFFQKNNVNIGSVISGGVFCGDTYSLLYNATLMAVYYNKHYRVICDSCGRCPTAVIKNELAKKNAEVEIIDLVTFQ